MKGPALSPLLTPIRVGPLTLPSRVLFGPHQTNFARSGVPGPQHPAYYAERARGGAGLIVIEEATVHPSSFPYERPICAYLPEVVEGWGRIAAAVRAAGGLAVAALGHVGAQADGSYTRREIWAPSPIPDTAAREVPKRMERADIEAVVAGFAAAAKRARQAELDGVEVNAGHRSLLRQFLSPLSNLRQDEYGGSLENRMRLLREVLAAVREQLGPAQILGLRLIGDEYAPWAGIKPEDAREIAAAVAGTVDYIAVEVGGPFTGHMVRAGMHAPQTYAVAAAAAVKAGAGSLPVAASGSIADPEVAAGVLASGIELVEMTRALIADPHLVNHLREGRPVRPCTLCNQDCHVSSPMNPLLTCAVNPDAGSEGRRPPGARRLNEAPRRVAVVGGGPAGMQAAVTLASQGHSVTLFERRERLGGALAAAASAPGRERWRLFLDYLEQRLHHLGVAVRCGQEADLDLIRAERPDAVVVAAGSRPRPHGLPVTGPPAVPILTPRAVLESPAPPGGAVLIVDREGGWPAVLAAEALARGGARVLVVTDDMFVSRDLAGNGELVPWYQRAAAAGIDLRAQTRVAAVEGRTVTLADRFAEEQSEQVTVDAIVVADHPEPEQALYLALKQAGFEVYRVGDCVAPRKVGSAIREAIEIGGVV